MCVALPLVANFEPVTHAAEHQSNLGDRAALGALKSRGGVGVSRAGAAEDGVNFSPLPAAPLALPGGGTTGNGAMVATSIAAPTDRGGNGSVVDNDLRMRLRFNVPALTRDGMKAKEPTKNGVSYFRLCQSHGTVHNAMGVPKCWQTGRIDRAGAAIPVLHEPYPKGTVLAKEVVAWFAGSYGGVSSGPFYATDDERMQAYDTIMAGPATVKCGGGAVSQAPQIEASAPASAPPAVHLDHPVLPLVRAEDGGLGRMMAANGPESGDNYR